MAKTHIEPLDLNFSNRAQAIASYLVLHSEGAVLVESGPGSTLERLKAGLQSHGLTVRDVTHVLLTHIHLDHAGAAGWLAQQGAQIYIHPKGAPHLIDPEHLLASAARIYGEKMNELWGELLPVPEDRLTLVQDGEEIVIGNLRLLVLYTPGHAEHHCAYLLEEACFSGDIGGVRMPGHRYLRLPFVPPELDLEKWRESLERLRQLHLRYIIPTHFGIFEDVEWHLQNACEQIDLALRWLETVMPADPPIEDLRQHFVAWLDGQARAGGLSDKVIQTYQIANPTWMSADGLQRYWRKPRMASGQA